MTHPITSPLRAIPAWAVLQPVLAMAVFTMAMFLGVAIMQWLTGLAASAATVLRLETYTAVFGAIAFFLLLGAALFRFLPGPERSQSLP